jgi:hypothetical protein
MASLCHCAPTRGRSSEPWAGASDAREPVLILYRPVGLKELQLIAESDYTAFPPRLREQPIFYPVLNFEYAEQIARNWNTRDPRSGFCGFVTRFILDDGYASRFEVRVVGSSMHQELWVPAEELPEFNDNIVGKITVEAGYFGHQFDSESELPAGVAGPGTLVCREDGQQ